MAKVTSWSYRILSIISISVLISITSATSCSVDIQRKIATLLEDGSLPGEIASSSDAADQSGHSRDDAGYEKVLCPAAMAGHNGDEDGSCCTATVRRRLMNERTSMDLTDWMLESANARLASRLNQSLAQLKDLIRVRLAASEHILHHTFEDTYPQAARPARSIIDRFFKSLQDELISADRRRSIDHDPQVSPPFEKSIERIITKFFSDLFPPVYACIWSMHCHDRGYALTRNYSECVSENFDQINPFGDVPRRLIAKLSISGKAIAAGIRFLKELSALIAPKQRLLWHQIWNRGSIGKNFDPCHTAVFQLNYCPLCSGANTTRPCRAACQSAVQLCVERQRHGPLARIDWMLNAAWNGFQTRVQQAAPPGQSMIFERVLDRLEIDIHDAITLGFSYADGASTVSAKVVDACGAIQNEAEEKAVANGRKVEKKRGRGHSKQKFESSLSDEKIQVRSTPIDMQGPIISVMGDLAKNLSATFTGYFGKRLASTICADVSAPNDVLDCWNPSRYSQATIASRPPESGLEKAAAASAVVAGSDAPGVSHAGGQQQTDVETRLKRITETMHRVRGPNLESVDGPKSERLVVADRAPSGSQQSPFMVRNDELGSSGDGAFGDDEEEGDDPNGEFGSGDVMFGPDGGVVEPSDPRSGVNAGRSPATDGVYPAEVDDYTTRKPGSTTTRRPGGKAAGAPRRTHVESEQRHPATKRPSGSASSYQAFSFVSLCLRLFASVSCSLALYCRTFSCRR